ncbi:hypothetical protein LOTGIDRAFT_228206 [Lottia gigantea]|uniref:Ras-GEF domain-containing protein n=1 Tax=Lottia gigantea TaxID=225164 RepID=V4AKA9_LOTGI|nr:hypothetical protein LOTGIDRAFT_228206 [Lottia gigantea]ESO97537.1 hypothetical protein LOTGIDRAFT_228206 [Lottia gigantea]
MEKGPIQKLLLTREYEDIEDIVLVESVFVELDKRGDGLQIVSLGLTPDRLILGRYSVINYHDDPELVYDGDRDLSTEGLEIKWLAPLDDLNISHIPDENILKITPRQCRARHFEFCTSDSVISKKVWNKWNNRLGYVTDDPYGYIRRKSLRVDAGDLEAEEVKVQYDSDSSSDEPGKATETMRNPKKENKTDQDEQPEVQSDTTKNKKKKRMNRLQKLLTVEGFQGIKDVILESPCFQLDHNGQVVRHVHVGMTESELLIAIQEVCDFHKANLNPNIDLELDGLRLHSSVPLERVRFYVVDDRSRKFAICSCVGEVQYFEQCNIPDGSDSPWADWVEFISKQDDPCSFGYKMWHILENLYSDKHHFKFIKRPFPFYSVESVACQTIEIRTSRQNEHPLTCYKNLKEELASVKSKYGIEETSTVNDKLMESSTNQIQPTKSNSSSTIREGCLISQNVRKFSLFSLVYQFCHGEKDRAIYEFLEYYPNSNLPVEILRIYAQILRYQYREHQRSESGKTYEGSVESESSITDVIAGFKAEEKSGPPVTDETLHLSPKKWSLLRSKLLKTKVAGLPTLSQVVSDVLFEKCDSKSKPSSITSFSPFEVSKEIMLMTSELIVKITHMDITQLQSKKIPSSILMLLEHFRLLTEIIKDDILDETKLLAKNQLLIFYIKVAKCCFEAGFLQTCEAVIIGLTSPEVFGLIRFWITLKLNAPKDLMSLYKMTNIIFIKDRYLKHIRQQTTENNVRFPLLDLFIQHARDINPDMDRFLGYHDYEIPKGQVVKKHGKSTGVKSSTSHIKPKKHKSEQNHKIGAKHTSSKVETTESLNKEDVLAQQRRMAGQFCDQILIEALEILHDETMSHYDNMRQRGNQESQNKAEKPKVFEHRDSLPAKKHKYKSGKQKKPKKSKRTKNDHNSPQQLTVQTSGSFDHQNRAIPAPKTFFRRKKANAKKKDVKEINKDQPTNLQEILEHNGQSTPPETGIERIPKNQQETGRSEVPKVQENQETSTDLKSNSEVNTESSMEVPRDLHDTSDPEDSQYFSTLHHQNMNSERRLSLFADESDDSLNQLKEKVIEDAIENKLENVRKHSIFEDSYLDEEVEKVTKEIPKKIPKETRRASIYNTLLFRPENQKTRRSSFLENLIFHDGEKPLIQNLMKETEKGKKEKKMKKNDEAEDNNVRFDGAQMEKTKKGKKNVTFGDVNQITYEEWNDQNMNSSFHHPTKPKCGLCQGPCLFSADLFQDVLRSQLLATTYINAHSPRLLLRRLINNKLKKCTRK